MTLYFAYGSNLNLSQMQRRCPAATPLGKLYLPKWRLVFRGVADIVPDDDATVPGGLWQLTPACEAALDRYEGWHPNNNGMYAKEFVEVDGHGNVMIYTMNSTGICPPPVYYFDGIRQGYKDFGLKSAALKEALKHSHDAKHLSHVERKRLRRNGRPTLKPDPRAKVTVAPEPPPWTPSAADLAMDRAAVRARAREADRASRALKGPAFEKWVRKVQADSRRNTLSEWLDAKRHSGERF